MQKEKKLPIIGIVQKPITVRERSSAVIFSPYVSIIERKNYRVNTLMGENFNFYERLKTLAKNRGISIKQMERDLHLAENSAKKWKDSMPGSVALTKLADYFGVSTDYLLDRESENKLDEDLRFALWGGEKGISEAQ